MLPEERRAMERLVKEMWEGGLNVAAIAKQTNFQPSEVLAILVRKGIKASDLASGRNAADARAAKEQEQASQALASVVVSAYVEGTPVPDIAKELGVDKREIYQILANEGVSLEDVKGLRNPHNELEDALGFEFSHSRQQVEYRMSVEAAVRLHEEICDLYAPKDENGVRQPSRGVLVKEVERRTGVNSDVMYRILNEHNVPLRRHPSHTSRKCKVQHLAIMPERLLRLSQVLGMEDYRPKVWGQSLGMLEWELLRVS